MKIVLDRIMKTPYLFISSCVEAAIYGGMELVVKRGTSSQMNNDLMTIVEEKKETRTVIFCRSFDEIGKLQHMLLKVSLLRQFIKIGFCVYYNVNHSFKLRLELNL